MTTREADLPLRINVRLRRSSLDGALATGIEERGALLEVRADQLRELDYRRGVAVRLLETVDASALGRAEVERLAVALRTPEPVRACGVAMAVRLLEDHSDLADCADEALEALRTPVWAMSA